MTKPFLMALFDGVQLAEQALALDPAGINPSTAALKAAHDLARRRMILMNLLVRTAADVADPAASVAAQTSVLVERTGGATDPDVTARFRPLAEALHRDAHVTPDDDRCDVLVQLAAFEGWYLRARGQELLTRISVG